MVMPAFREYADRKFALAAEHVRSEINVFLENFFKGRRFISALVVEETTTAAHKSCISSKCFQKCFHQLYSHWQKGTVPEGEFFNDGYA